MNRGTGAAVLVSCALVGCAQAPIKPAANHIRAEEASAPGAIPPPVQVTPVLPKPFTIDQLGSKVADILAGAPKER